MTENKGVYTVSANGECWLTRDGDVAGGRVVDVAAVQRVGDLRHLVQLDVQELVDQRAVLEVEQNGGVLADGHALGRRRRRRTDKVMMDVRES